MHLVEGGLDEKDAQFVIHSGVAESFAWAIDIIYRRAYSNFPAYAMPAKQDDISLNSRFSDDLHISIDPF